MRRPRRVAWWRAPRLGTAVLLTLCVAAPSARAQDPLPVLHARSRTVHVRDGDRLLKGIWTCDPSVALDVYDARRTREPKTVAFLTDVDSIAFTVEPRRVYDFVVRLEDGGQCRTRISTLTQGYARSGAGPDTIPIAIRRGKLHLAGTVNGSQPLDLIFDTGASLNVLYPSGAKRGAALQFDGVTTNVGTGGATVRRTSHDNRLEVAGLRWEHEPFVAIEKQADDADGIVGFPAFEDRVVEFDYDRMVMVVHDTLPGVPAKFARTPMLPAGALTAVEVTLGLGSKQSSGPFVLDTGGAGTMNVNQAFAQLHGLRAALRSLGTSNSRGVGRGVVRNDVLMLPELTLAGFTLHDLPIHAERGSGESVGAGLGGGTLDMDVLARFNAYLDYPRAEAYFRPNGRFAAPFPARRSSPLRLALVAITGSVVAALVGLGLRRRSRT